MNVATETYRQTTTLTARLRESTFVLAFSATLFCSAFLMFSIQPLMGKLLLPLLGGTPQVWNSCMVFFQAVLFAGYLHAHYTGVWLGLRRQAILHLVIALAALIALPIGLSQVGPVADAANPALWILSTLAISVGAPMFVISSTAPLLQKWFSHTSHPAARDPYFLYVASNLGSLLALLAYPTVIEPWIDLGSQALLLSGGFVLLVVAIASCAVISQLGRAPLVVTSATTTTGSLPDQTVSVGLKARWVLLAFAPSSLLLGVTTYITTDIAAAPLLWIVPLALYLLTFIIAFARKPLIGHPSAIRAHGLLVAAVAVTMLLPAAGREVWWFSVVHLLAFFAVALVCHGELVRSRPAARHLTHFYLWLSFGGVLGGVFNALVAPSLFNQPLEYALVLVLACWLRPAGERGTRRERRDDFVLPLAMLAVVLAALWSLGAIMEQGHNRWTVAFLLTVAVGAGLALLRFSERRVRFGMGMGAILLASMLVPAMGVGIGGQSREVLRSFFGIYEVYHDTKRDATILRHGTTIHGAQLRDERLSRQPVSYYHAGGAFGQLFGALGDRLENREVAIVGLGTGGLTCYGRSTSAWTYYEIDPLIETIARDPRHFTYLRDCPPRTAVVVGDARLMLRKAPERHYALIVVDAFSSDAIPTHLLTREAMAGYLEKLAPGGVVALHISNRYMNLEPIVGNLARDAGLVGRINVDIVAGMDTAPFADAALVAVLARDEASLGTLASDPGWRALATRPGQRVWSDDYVNVLSALRW